MKELTIRVLIALVIATVIRVGFALVFQGPVYFGGISSGYIEAAKNFLAGNGFTVTVDASKINEPSKLVSVFFYMRPIAYSIFLASVFSVFWNSLIAVQIIQALIGVLNCFLIYLTTKKIFGQKSAEISVFFSALFLPMARFETTLLPDALVGFLLLVGIYFLLRDDFVGAALFGILTGLATEFRPDSVLLPFFILPFLLISRNIRQALTRWALIIVMVALVLIPNTIANYKATNKIIPLGIGNGISMWEGISQFGDKYGTVFGDERAAAVEGYRLWWYPNGVERDQKRFKEPIKIIEQHPVWYVGMLVKRSLMIFTIKGLFPSPVEYQNYLVVHPGASYLSYLRHEPISALLKIFWTLLGWALFILAAMGFFTAMKTKRWRLAFPIALTIFYYFIVHIPTNAEPRYFFPMFGFEIVLASYFISRKTLKHESKILEQQNQ